MMADRSCFAVVALPFALAAAALVGCGHNDPAPATAGGAGASSAPSAPAAGKECPVDFTIDDCEDGTNQVKVHKGRNGYWYTFIDKAGSTISPPANHTFIMSKGGVNGSMYAAQILGKMSATGDPLYSGMGFNFTDPKGQYDASAYTGVSFYAKTSSSSVKAVRLKVPDASTDPDGKVCTECFNDFGADLSLSDQWKQYVVPFSDMAQMEGWGAPHPKAVDRSKIYSMQWQVNSPGAEYDIWVDAIAFTGCP
jgi:endoglucanase